MLKAKDADCLLDSQIPLYNEYEICHLDGFSIMTIDLMVNGGCKVQVAG